MVNNKLGFNLSNTLWEEIIKYYKDTYSGVIPDVFLMEDFAMQRLMSAKEQLDKVKLRLPNLHKKAVCLDAGCGLGSFLVLANLSGYNFFGYDLDENALNIAKKLLKENGLSLNKVSKSPEFNKKFDLITSFEVMEHVSDANSYIKNLRKNISDKGVLVIETPNYLIPYEPHYYIFLPPGPKKIRWLVWKILGGRNNKFFNELNFVTSFGLSRILKNNQFIVEDLGKKVWMEEILGKPSNQRSRYVKNISRVIKVLKLGWLVKITVNLGLYTPQIYLCYPK